MLKGLPLCFIFFCGVMQFVHLICVLVKYAMFETNEHYCHPKFCQPFCVQVQILLPTKTGAVSAHLKIFTSTSSSQEMAPIVKSSFHVLYLTIAYKSTHYSL